MIILPKIDDDYNEWLMLSAPYVDEDFNAPSFIKYLDILKDKEEQSKTAEYIGNIFLKMLEKNTPNFDQKHIRSIVEFFTIQGKRKTPRKFVLSTAQGAMSF